MLDIFLARMLAHTIDITYTIIDCSCPLMETQQPIREWKGAFKATLKPEREHTCILTLTHANTYTLSQKRMCMHTKTQTRAQKHRDTHACTLEHSNAHADARLCRSLRMLDCPACCLLFGLLGERQRPLFPLCAHRINGFAFPLLPHYWLRLSSVGRLSVYANKRRIIFPES